jgi:hypothetical protein
MNIPGAVVPRVARALWCAFSASVRARSGRYLVSMCVDVLHHLGPSLSCGLAAREFDGLGAAG